MSPLPRIQSGPGNCRFIYAAQSRHAPDSGSFAVKLISQFAPTIPETPSTLNSSVKPSALESPKSPLPETNYLPMPDVPEGEGSPSQNPFIFLCFFMLIFMNAT